MRAFSKILAVAAKRKGGADALERQLLTPLTRAELAAIPADRWLSEMTRCVFQAGFDWSLIDKKWKGFEVAFGGFDVNRWLLMSDDDVHQLTKAPGIVANVPKIRSVGANAAFLVKAGKIHGTVGAYFASWAPERYMELLQALKAEGSRLGGKTGQVFLRRMGVDSLIFTESVVAALIREGIITRIPSAKKDFSSVQAALDSWCAESGRGLTQISQVLAYSVA